jgi:glycosyltransferase domain-containing protein
MNKDRFLLSKKITILLHTRNRPQFVLRLMDYYRSKIALSEIKIIVLDSSNEINFNMMSAKLACHTHNLEILLLHHKEGASFAYRLDEALANVTTPYVLLAADDDFYFFDWLHSAVDLLDTDNSFGVVYGHTLRFGLETNDPYGKLCNFLFQKPNPPVRWLEGKTLVERMDELGKSDWATAGWYALQRTEILTIIVEKSRKYNIDGYHFERFLVFCQAALTKTRKLNEIYLARQMYIGEKGPPFSYKIEQKSLANFKQAAVEILLKYKGLELKTASGIVDKVLRAEVSQLIENDSRKYLRMVGDRFPYLRNLKRKITMQYKHKITNLENNLTDPRFPVSPNISIEHSLVKEIIEFTKHKSSH